MGWWNKLVRDKKTETVEKTSEEIRREALEAEKALATKNGEPWVAVLDTQVNPENIKYGFFELDWNNEFIEQLLDAGYTGETNEQIVDAWFRTIVSQMMAEDGYNDVNTGIVNVKKLDQGKSEVS